MLVPSATSPSQQARSSPRASGARPVDMDESVLEYGVLRVPAAIACMLAHASCNNLGYTLTQCESQSLSPRQSHLQQLPQSAHRGWLCRGTHLLRVRARLRRENDWGALGGDGCGAVRGELHGCASLALAPSPLILPYKSEKSLCGTGATLETTLQRLGIKQLTIRRGVCLINNAIQAACCLGFGLSQTPRMATLMNCGVCLCDCFQGIGFSQNYYEVGGPDTAILTSVGNVFASLGGMIAPPVGAWLLATTGKWYPLYAIAAGIHVFAGAFFAAFASDTPARQLLYGAGGGPAGVENDLRKSMLSGR
jgi:hypothetical protein